MPFHSKKQWRAAFGGHIPGIGRRKAREWAHETSTAYKRLPMRVKKSSLLRGVPAVAGRWHYRDEESPVSGFAADMQAFRAAQADPGNYVTVRQRELRERQKRSSFAKLATALVGAKALQSSISGAGKAGVFKGTAPKPIRREATGSVNPRMSLTQAFKA